MAAWKGLLFAALFVFIAFAILNPNPFGNNPDIIFDESYFLTSALSAIEHTTLPGWDFPASGTYYGGPQTYLDTAVLVPVVGAVLALSDFSVTVAKIWVASNTGELLYILRLVSGVGALATLIFFFFYFKRREIPRPLALSLVLFLFLLLSNVLVIEFLHTAKVWAFYIIMVAAASAVFIANEYYLSRLNTPFMRTERYTALLVWSGVLVFFQSYVGVFSIALLTLYALLLRHISVHDLSGHLRRYWYLIVLFALTQISFLYQGYKISGNFSDVSTKTAEGTIDWATRLGKPLLFAFQSQPLVILYVAGVLALLFLALQKRAFFDTPRKRMYLVIACVHPVLVYVIFHVIIGFDILPRYAILLTLACAFSAAILMSELGAKAATVALCLGGVLFLAVGVQAITLYWQPSSETVLLRTIMQNYNTPDTAFIVDHSARRLTLPVNTGSLDLLDDERRQMSRFAFLLQNRERLPASEFKPLTATAYRPEQEAAYIAQLSGTHSVWMVRTLCTERCSAGETAAGTCFEINMNACEKMPHEINTLPEFLGATQLGYSYVVRKVR